MIILTWNIAYQIELANWAPDINDLELNSIYLILKSIHTYVTRPRRLIKWADIENDESKVQIPDNDKNIVWNKISQSRPNLNIEQQ
jgi:hypothetical protein